MLRFSAIAVALMLAGHGYAAKPFPYAPFQKGVDAPAASVTRATGRFDAADGRLLALYRPDFQASATSTAGQLLEFVDAFQAQLRLPVTAGHALQLNSVRDFGPFTVFRMQQVYRDLAVYGSELVVSVDKQGRVVFVQAAIDDVFTPARSATVDAAAALEAAATYLRAEGIDHLQQQEMWWMTDNEAKRVWRVFGEPDGNGREWELLVDAASGTVVRAEDKTLNFDGSGRVFNPDPLSSAQATYGSAGYVDGNDANTPELQAQLATVPIRDLTLTSGVYPLSGPYAVCVDWDTPAGTCPTSADGNFFYTRDDDNFEAVNVYFHIDAYMRYINQTLGIALTPRQYVGGVQFDPRGFQGQDNSSFSTATGRLRFGEGGVDDAEDADVVIHELGHGIHDWITNGGLSQTQGLSEGVGDYVAASYSRSFNHWPTNAAPYFWMFDWDGHNPFWPGRITNYHLNVTYQTLPSGLHTPGQYWASCNLLNYNSIGRQASDRAFLLGLAMTGATTNQQDAAQAVLNAAATAGFSPTQLQTMHANFTAGTSDPGNRRCSYVLTLPVGPIVFQDGFE